MTDHPKPMALDQASSLALSIASDMGAIAFDSHNGRTLEALQNDANRLRRGGKHPESSSFVGQVQLDLDRLAKECQVPEVHITNSGGSIKFDLPQYSTMPGNQFKADTVEARFTPGKPAQTFHVQPDKPKR